MTGITMIESKLRGILERAGVHAIDPVGEPFDPSQHEAVATDPGSTGSTVIEVYQKGYAIGDMLVRPAMVRTGDATGKMDA
jgi:molecular chaperone GrpE